MISKKFTLDGQEMKLDINGLQRDTWINYHVTKHIILGYEKEGFEDILEIEKDDIISTRSEQTQRFKCNVSEEKEVAETCKKCKYTEDCFRLIKPLREKYVDLITKGVKQDNDKPRHAHYKHLRTINSTKLIDGVVFLDNYGANIICGTDKKKLWVKSYFRMNPYYKLSSMKISFDSIQHKMELAVKMNANKWKTKMNRRGYKNIIKHVPQNW